MIMELFDFTDKKDWDDFVRPAASYPLSGAISSLNSGAEYLQSWEWGEILRSEGEEIYRVGVREEGEKGGKTSGGGANNGRILAAATLVKKKIFFSYFYWYAPRGPIFSPSQAGKNGQAQRELNDFLFSEISRFRGRALFCRLEPREKIEGPAFKKTIDLQPAQTLLLDLDKSEDALLKAMQPKTRYNIRLAEKKGVRVIAATSADFSEFWRLMRLTGERDNFRIHEARHYEKMLQAPDNFIRLFLARYEGKNIAAGLFCSWGDKATYLHGASDNEYRNVMAPYLLQWSAIKEAREAGRRYYDFYGLDEKKWPGVTRFKLGFGGRRVIYPGTYDAVFRPFLYNLYNFLRRLRRLA